MEGQVPPQGWRKSRPRRILGALAGQSPIGGVMHHRARLGVALAVIGIVSSCKSERSPDAAGGPEATKTSPSAISVSAKDFSFEAPGRIPAGATTFRLTNHGKELHQAQLLKLEDG